MATPPRERALEPRPPSPASSARPPRGSGSALSPARGQPETPRPAPEGVPEAVAEVQESFLIHGQDVACVVVDVAFAPHAPHQLLFGLLSGSAVAQEGVAA